MSVTYLAIKPSVIMLTVVLVALVCGRVHATSASAPVLPAVTAPSVAAPMIARDAAVPFAVAEGTGGLLVLLRHPQSLAVALRTPAGQLLTTNNIWRVGRWYADDAVDVICVDAPSAGDWQVVGVAAGSGTLFIAQDLALVPVNAPQYVANDRVTVVRWRLQAQGQAVDSTPLAPWLVARAHLSSESGGVQDVSVRRAADGMLEVAVPPLPAAAYTLELEAWVKPLGLRAKHTFTSAPAPAIRYEQRGADTVLWVTSNASGLESASMALVATVQGPDQRTRYLSGTRLANGSFRLLIAGGDWRGIPGDLRVGLELQGRTLAGKPWHAPTRVLTFANGAPSMASVPTPVGERQGESLKPTPSGQSAVRSRNVGGQHSLSDHAAHTVGKAQISKSGPSMMNLAALLLANLVLVALVVWRARVGRRAAAMATTVATDAVTQSEAHADRDPSDAVDDGSVAASPVDGDTAEPPGAATSETAAAPSLEALLAPVVEAQEIIVDDDLLADLAAMAATQSDLRTHPAADAA